MSRRPAKSATGESPVSAVAVASEGLGMALLRARECVLVNVRPVLRRHGLTDQQWRILRMLGFNPPLSPTALSRLTAILLPSLLRILKVMEEGDLVRSQKAPSGSRILVSLAPGGVELLKSVKPKVAVAREPIGERLSLDEVAALQALLAKLYGGKEDPEA